MAPWNVGADRSLGRSPTYRPLPAVFRNVQTAAGLCSAQPQCEHLRYVRAALNLRYGATSRLIYLGETNGLESSEDCRSTGGHGNQHVRLRSAQIDRIEAICPASQAIRLLRAVAGVRRPGCQDGGIYPHRVTVFEGLGTHVDFYQRRLLSTSSQPVVRGRFICCAAFKRPLYRKVALRAPVRKVGKIAGRGPVSEADARPALMASSESKILRGHQMNPARPGGRSDLACADVAFLEARRAE